ncbi:MAG: hypothetical protein ACKO0Z_08080 [Betaproteobacteria bacterium]
MSLNFKNQTATLKNMNFRKEAHGDEKISAIDLKINVLMSAKNLGWFHPDLEDMLFNHAHVRFPNMDAISWEGEIEHCDILIDSIHIKDAKLKKFSMKPMLDPLGARQVDTVFTVSYYPTENNLVQLGEKVQDTITIDLDTQELIDV